MAVSEVKEYSVVEWSALTPAPVAAPVPWSTTSRCVQVAGYMGRRGGVLVVRLGDGAEAKSLCVKPFDARLVNATHELVAADILRAAGVRVPDARMATQAEIDDQILPALMAKFENTTGSWTFPDFLTSGGLYWSREDLRQMAGIPSNVVAEQAAAAKASRAARRAAVEAGEARAEPVAVLEFVRGPTLAQCAGATALGEREYEALGRIAAVDVLLNNFDRFPVLFDTEGNLGNVLLEPSAATGAAGCAGGVAACCAIDSCVQPLEGAALARYLARVRAEAATPDLTALAAALAGALGTPALLEQQLHAIRRGWRQGLAKIGDLRRSGELQAVLLARTDAAAAAGAPREKMQKATSFVQAVADAIADAIADADDNAQVTSPQPNQTPQPTPTAAEADAHPENRLSGASGLGAFLVETCAALPADAVALFAFDFDKTLTNGFASPGAALEQRVRGGQPTLDGLRATAALPRSRRCIVTARADETGRVSQGKLQQVVAQLSKAQPELLAYFDVPHDESCHRIVELVLPRLALEGCSAAQAADTEDVAPAAAPAAGWRDVPRASWGPGMYATLEGEGPILFGRSIYASGYAKPLALLLACTAEAAEPPTHVFFIDDAPNNAYEVQRDLPVLLRQWAAAQRGASGGSADEAAAVAAAKAAAVVVRALWWDLHDEEFVAGTATPTTSGPDFAYLRDHLQQGFVYDAALRHFGLSPADIAERAEKYERVHQERAQRRLAQAAADSSSAQSAPQAEASGSGSSVLDRRGQLHELLVANGRVPA